MADLTASYMGIPVKNPLIVGSSSLTRNIGTIRKLEDEGAAAVVLSSLLEETIQLQNYKTKRDKSYFDKIGADVGNIFPNADNEEPEEHLMWARKAKKAVDIPVIASLNCTNVETWVEWSGKLEETGVDGLELNFYAIHTEKDRTGAEIENYEVDAVKAIVDAVKIPVSVKLSPVYTNPLNVVTRLDEAGASAFVLFNRLWHPEIDIDAETTSFPFRLSSSGEHGLPLRYVGLFAGEVNASLCAASGIHEGSDAIQLLLAGADTFQVVTALYHYGLQIEKILGDIEAWMDRKGYESIDQFRGKLSAANSEERWTYRRAQYVRHLVNNKDYIKRSMALQIGRDEDDARDSSV